METFFMSLRLFSATSAYFCDLKSERPQIFKKWCSSTDSKTVGNRWLANSNAFYVKQLCRISEIALASPKPNKSYFIDLSKQKSTFKIFKFEWSMTYLAWGRQGLFQIFFKVVLHKRHCCWPTTYFLPFLSLLMNIIFWKFEATQTWGRRNMLRLLKTASGS